MQIRDSSLYNEDLAPVPADGRTWGTWNIAALWVGMAVCIPTYTLSAGLISQGMSWKQALLTIALGNLIVLVPMILNAHAGTRYGIPFPVLLRASFGTVGELGNDLFTRFFYPFEAISLLLVVAMIGAVLLAKRRL